MDIYAFCRKYNLPYPSKPHSLSDVKNYLHYVKYSLPLQSSVELAASNRNPQSSSDNLTMDEYLRMFRHEQEIEKETRTSQLSQRIRKTIHSMIFSGK